MALMVAVLSRSAVAAETSRDQPLAASLTATLATDYVSRGISLSEGQPAYQATFEVVTPRGFYLNSFVSRAAFADTRVHHEIDGSLGFRREVRGTAIDIAAAHYAYPGSNYSYSELVIAASHPLGPIIASASFAYSPAFFAHAGRGFYLQAGADLPLPGRITGSLRGGRQWAELEEKVGLPDYTWLSIGASRVVTRGLTLGVAIYGTSVPRRTCAPTAFEASGQRICRERAVLSVATAF